MNGPVTLKSELCTANNASSRLELVAAHVLTTLLNVMEKFLLAASAAELLAALTYPLHSGSG